MAKATSKGYKLPCGCVHDDVKYVSMCDPCKKDFTDRHNIAMIDYRKQQKERLLSIAGDTAVS